MAFSLWSAVNHACFVTHKPVAVKCVANFGFQRRSKPELLTARSVFFYLKRVFRIFRDFSLFAALFLCSTLKLRSLLITWASVS